MCRSTSRDCSSCSCSSAAGTGQRAGYHHRTALWSHTCRWGRHTPVITSIYINMLPVIFTSSDNTAKCLYTKHFSHKTSLTQNISEKKKNISGTMWHSCDVMLGMLPHKSSLTQSICRTMWHSCDVKLVLPSRENVHGRCQLLVDLLWVWVLQSTTTIWVSVRGRPPSESLRSNVADATSRRVKEVGEVGWVVLGKITLISNICINTRQCLLVTQINRIHNKEYL